MYITWIRHGADSEAFRGGWSQWPLIEQGRLQSARLARYLQTRPFPIERLISSDLPRAIETSQYISEALALPVEATDAWRETNNGVLAGMPVEEADANYPGLSFKTLAWDERFPDGESPKENYERIAASYAALIADVEATQKSVLVVTHSAAINMIYHISQGLPFDHTKRAFKTANTSIHQQQFVDGTWQWVRQNETPHLEGGV